MNRFPWLKENSKLIHSIEKGDIFEHFIPLLTFCEQHKLLLENCFENKTKQKEITEQLIKIRNSIVSELGYDLYKHFFLCISRRIPKGKCPITRGLQEAKKVQTFLSETSDPKVAHVAQILPLCVGVDLIVGNWQAKIKPISLESNDCIAQLMCGCPKCIASFGNIHPSNVGVPYPNILPEKI